ncbi:MAG: septum formation initiator family protein [Muribaculaceae bacterium]|nr:septum formation initiator family protein [Muribaculaceae bacterium]
MTLHRPKWIPRWLNLPFLFFLAFIVLLLFFGEYNYLRINSLANEIDDLKEQIKEQEDSAAYYTSKLNALNTDKENLERLCREQYGMKRVNEEVYITDIP